MFEVFDVFWISTHQSTWRVQRDGAAVSCSCTIRPFTGKLGCWKRSAREYAIKGDFLFSIFLCDLQVYWPYRTTFFFEFHLCATLTVLCFFLQGNCCYYDKRPHIALVNLNFGFIHLSRLHQRCLLIVNICTSEFYMSFTYVSRI